MAETTKIPRPEAWRRRQLLDETPTEALVLLWSRDEPGRAGEVVLFPADEEGPWIFGRGEAQDDDPRRRAALVRQRPGRVEPMPPLACPWISRTQLVITRRAPGTLHVENVGRCALRLQGEEAAGGPVAAGDLVELRGELLFLCLARSTRMPIKAGYTAPGHPFGEPDASGLVGESPAAWALRADIAAAARTSDHALVLGTSGSGKELVAQAIHAQSEVGRRPIVSRSAPTIPTGIASAELFGNRRGYPSADAPDRAGLVGAASGSTLFLDEVAELPIEAQTQLLRVLDKGEYQRLGEDAIRTSKLRVVGATNRPTSELREDVLRRFKRTIDVPDLNERREDIPQLVTHLLRHRAAGPDRSLADRFFAPDGQTRWPRLTPELVGALVKHRYATNVRELEALLIVAVDGSPGTYIELTDKLRATLGASEQVPDRRSAPTGIEETGFDERERARLEVLRRHDFRPGLCEHDRSSVLANRQNWHDYERQLIWRALVLAGLDVPRAAALLAGRDGGALFDRASDRVHEQVRRMARHPTRPTKGGLADWSAVIEAIRDGRLGARA